MLCTAISTTLTHIRRLVKGNNVYLYEVTCYSNMAMGKVSPRSEYSGKEIIKDNIVTVGKTRNSTIAHKALEPAPFIMYRFTDDFGIQDYFISTMDSLTIILEAGKIIVLLVT